MVLLFIDSQSHLHMHHYHHYHHYHHLHHHLWCSLQFPSDLWLETIIQRWDWKCGRRKEEKLIPWPEQGKSYYCPNHHPHLDRILFLCIIIIFQLWEKYQSASMNDLKPKTLDTMFKVKKLNTFYKMFIRFINNWKQKFQGRKLKGLVTAINSRVRQW